jgi:hypothetical protein
MVLGLAYGNMLAGGVAEAEVGLSEDAMLDDPIPGAETGRGRDRGRDGSGCRGGFMRHTGEVTNQQKREKDSQKHKA